MDVAPRFTVGARRGKTRSSSRVKQRTRRAGKKVAVACNNFSKYDSTVALLNTPEDVDKLNLLFSEFLYTHLPSDVRPEINTTDEDGDIITYDDFQEAKLVGRVERNGVGVIKGLRHDYLVTNDELEEGEEIISSYPLAAYFTDTSKLMVRPQMDLLQQKLENETYLMKRFKEFISLITKLNPRNETFFQNVLKTMLMVPPNSSMSTLSLFNKQIGDRAKGIRLVKQPNERGYLLTFIHKLALLQKNTNDWSFPDYDMKEIDKIRSDKKRKQRILELQKDFERKRKKRKVDITYANSIFQKVQGEWVLSKTLQNLKTCADHINDVRAKDLDQDSFLTYAKTCGLWLQISLKIPGGGHLVTVIIKDGKVFTFGGGYGEDHYDFGPLHVGGMWIYSPDTLLANSKDNVVEHSQEFMKWGFYNTLVKNELTSLVKQFADNYKQDETSFDRSEQMYKVSGYYSSLSNRFFYAMGLSNCAVLGHCVTGGNSNLSCLISLPNDNSKYGFWPQLLYDLLSNKKKRRKINKDKNSKWEDALNRL